MTTSKPKVVKIVTHKALDAKGRKLGHVGLVQRRSNESLAKFGGKRFASWAQRTVNGHLTGCPERFAAYDTEAEARAHAEYSAGQMTPTAAELDATGGRAP